jgi:hypothetical protein
VSSISSPLTGQAEGAMLLATSVVWLMVANVVLCVPRNLSTVEEKLAVFLTTEYEKLASEACKKYSLASWNYQTDVENETKVEQFVSKIIIILQGKYQCCDVGG